MPRGRYADIYVYICMAICSDLAKPPGQQSGNVTSRETDIKLAPKILRYHSADVLEGFQGVYPEWGSPLLPKDVKK